MAKNLQDYTVSILQKVNQAIASGNETKSSCEKYGVEHSAYSSLSGILSDLSYAKSNSTYSGLSNSSTASSIRDRLKDASGKASALVKDLVAIGNIKQKIPYTATRGLNYRNTTTVRNSYVSSPAKEMSQSINSALDEVNSYIRASLFQNTVGKIFHEDGDTDAELEHYGRLGMKWGMHIFGEEKEAHRAVKKVRKADKKATSSKNLASFYGLKGEELSAKAHATTNSRLRNRRFKQGAKYFKRGVQYTKRSSRSKRRAQKIVEAMNKQYENINISSFSTEEIAIGEKYCIDVIRRYDKERLKEGG